MIYFCRKTLALVLTIFLEKKPAGVKCAVSAARVCAIACCIAGIFVAVRHPEQSATVATLIGGGAVALLTRAKPGA